MYISRIQIKNIRCFKELDISFDLGGQSPPWTVIVGDNAAGKTCLLKSIAIGLCDVSSAAGLLRESEEGYIRRGAEREGARIIIHLRDEKNLQHKYEITTEIEDIELETARGEKSSYERVSQRTSPEESFPWGKIFACAYGAGRGTSATGDIAGYATISAVYNMFNYNEGLQNPELVIRRMEMEGKFPHNSVFRILEGLMPNVKQFNMEREGITASGQWGDQMPLRDLADGYKSTFVWVCDMIGWALSYNPRIQSGREISGIVLLDEIEQHLHPQWQKSVVKLLREQFPKVQFIATTHSPLVASNIPKIGADEPESKLFYLFLEDEVAKSSEVQENLSDLNAAQILSSEAFGYIFNINPKVDNILKEASILAGKDKRTTEEDAKLEKFKDALKEIMFPKGRTLIERVVERDYYRELEKKIEEFRKYLNEGK